jgi:MFS family permease
MVLLLLCCAQFVIVLDVTIVAVALPSIQEDLGFSAAGLQWVVTAYSLAFGGLLVSSGRAADVFGRRRLFVAGLALFSAASAGCGLAHTPALLVTARALQGIGAALLAPAALALVTDAYPDAAERRRALGLWTAAAAGGGATGWALGGILTSTVGWPAIFYMNLPVGIAGVVLAPRLLPREDSRAAGRGLAALDLPGALLVTGGLVAVVLGLEQAQEGRFGPALVLGVALLVLFAVVERRVAAPLLPPGTFGDRDFTCSVLVALALTASTTPAVLLSVLYQEQELHRSALETGLSCMAFNLAVIGASLLANRLALAHRTAMALGLAGVAAGALLLNASLIGGYVVMGASLALASVASTAMGTAALGSSSGLASGLLNAAAQVGPALGLALLIGLGTTGYIGAAAIALGAVLTTVRGAPRSAGLSRPRRAT